MSRIGKMPVVLPKGVTANIQGSTIAIKGPKGELKQTFHADMTIRVEDGKILVERPDSSIYDAMHGMVRAIINNMVLGVTQGFKKDLEVEGVGYRGEMQGDRLVLSLGFSHPVPVDPPAGIKLSVDKSQRILSIEGINKELVGEIAAKIRSLRPPEPYKGKGIHYLGEKVRRKAGKAGKVGAK
ncbi:MAG: 50S ribosomal protein L6 [Anaerolineae bacterium]